MGNWWDVITAPVQQAVSNLGSNLSAARADAQQLGSNIYPTATANEVTFTPKSTQTNMSQDSSVSFYKPASSTTDVTTPIRSPDPSKLSRYDGGDTTHVTTPIRSPDPSTLGRSSSSSKSGGVTSKTGGGTASWIEPISTRPGFKKTEDLGLDAKTWDLVSQGNTPLQAVTMRLSEETNPRIKRELVWQQRQLDANKIEVGSEYHAWAKDTGKSQNSNPFEYQADRAVDLMHGTDQGSRYQTILPSEPGTKSYGVGGYLTNGKGLDTAGWDQAKTGFNAKYPDFKGAVDWVEAANNRGPYSSLSSNSDYSAWNKAHPDAFVNTTSPDNFIYGTKRSQKFSYDVGGFGRKTEPKTKHQIKKYDKSIHETLFGSDTPRKPVTRRQPARGIKGTEWDMLSEFGIRRPIAKKPEKALKDNLRYRQERGSFQSMRKPTTSIRNVVIDEIEELENRGLLHKKSKKSVKKKGVK